MDHRRNLLFGILAVQIRKITPGKMAEMAAAAAADPEGDLPARLLDERLISPDDHRLLVSLVDEAIKEHGGDTEAAIQWLRGTESVYESLSAAIESRTAPYDRADSGKALDEDLARTLHDAREIPGRYWLKSEHARGGQGRLLLVHDETLGRDVILKELLPIAQGSKETPTPVRRTASLVARFLQEAKITSQLEHPSIVPVYEVGLRPDQTPYYTMKLLKGKTLSAAFRECTGLPDRLGLLRQFADICQGLAYAHSRGVIHRDLKPSNIMIGAFGETVILDWGLAKVLGKPDAQFDAFEKTVTAIKVGVGSHGDKTAPGAVIGTPAYMSPEQARGELEKVDKRSDVYGLGMILYELIAGRLPFDRAPVSSILYVVANEDLRPCTDFQADAPPELVAICNRCLERDPNKRYQDAAELAADIERFMSGALVAAYTYSFRDIVARYYRRHRVMANTVAAFVLALAAFGVYSYVTISIARDREAAAHAAAEDEKYETQLHLAQSYVRQNNYAAARATLWATVPEQRNWEWGYLLNRCYLDLFSLDGCVAAAFSPDGTRLATMSRTKAIEIWNAENGTRIAEFGEDSKRTFYHEYSPDGTRILGAGQDGAIRIWDSQTGALVAALTGHTKNILSARFDGAGQRIVSASSDRTVRVWDAASGATIVKLEMPDTSPISAAFRAGGDIVIVETVDDADANSARVPHAHHICAWEPTTNRIRFSVQGAHPALRPDGSLLAAGDGADVLLVGLPEGDVRARLTGHTGFVSDLRFSADGATLLSGSGDGTARLFNVGADGPPPVLVHGRAIDHLRISQDGKHALTASGDGTLKIWNMATGGLVTTLAGHSSFQLFSVDFSPDSERIATGSIDQTVKVWNVEGAPGQRTLATYDGPINRATVSRDGTLLAVIRSNRTMEIRRTADGAVLAAMASYNFWGGADAAFSPDGKRIAAALDEFTPMVWDIQTLRVTATLTGHTGPVYCVAYSPDGKHVATGSWDNTARIWDAETGAAVLTLSAHKNSVRDIAFSEDGKFLVTASEDGTAILWDMAGGRILHTFETHGGSVLAVGLSRDGKLLATAGEDQPTRIWDVASGLELQSLPSGSASVVDAIVFTADGSRLATSAKSGPLRIWSVRTGGELLSTTEDLCIAGPAFMAQSSGLATTAAGPSAVVALVPAAWAPERLALAGPLPERERVAALRGADAGPAQTVQSAITVAVATTPARAQAAMTKLASAVSTADASLGAIAVDGPVYDALAPLCALRGDLLVSVNDVAVSAAEFGGKVAEAQRAPGEIAIGIRRKGAPMKLACRTVEGVAQTLEREVDGALLREYFEKVRRAEPAWLGPALELDRSRASDMGEPPAEGKSIRSLWVTEPPQVAAKPYLIAFGLARDDRLRLLDDREIADYEMVRKLGDAFIASDGKEGPGHPIRLDVERGMFTALRLTIVPR